jgi:hypothetical protein
MSQNKFLWGVIVISLACVILLSGCEDRYRYVCQNPDKFDLPECQKPRCLFTQTCPEYLVAPILTTKVEQPPKVEEKKADDDKK